jgi:hypothetical protein
MLKKILYIIVSFLVGFMLLSSIVVTNFYSSFQELIAEDVKNNQYTSAERFFSRVVDNRKFYSKADGQTMIEVYSALNDNIKFVYDSEGKLVTNLYDISLFEGILMVKEDLGSSNINGSSMSSGLSKEPFGQDDTIYFLVTSNISGNLYLKYSSFGDYLLNDTRKPTTSVHI